MSKTGSNSYRRDFTHWEGVNRLVADNLSDKAELYYAENVRCTAIGSMEKRQGYRRLGNVITATGNYGIFYFESLANSGDGYFYRISTVGGVTSIYYLNTSAIWTALSGGGTSLSAQPFFGTTAENCYFLVNNTNNNRYISGADGTTIVDSTNTAGHLYNSPKANKINYYKDRLYLADYTVGSTRYKTSIMMSSVPLGILSLVDGDHAISGATVIDVTDTKYIYVTDTLDIYRGGSKVGTASVSAKTETSITATISFESGYTSLNSSDELWVGGTYSGTRIFRWADNPKSGLNVKQYDTFKLTGGRNDRIRMLTNIGDIMIIANKNTYSVWNDYSLKNYDLNIGCVSDQGYVKSKGVLFFISYDGIYATMGEDPQLISSKIKDYFDGATKAVKEAATMGKKDQSIFCGLSATTLYNPDGSIEKTLADVVLEYNLRDKNWYVHTGIKATEFATYQKSADTDALEFSSNDTGYHIYEFLFGQKDDGVTSDKQIHFRADTRNINLSNNFEDVGYPTDVIVETERGSNIHCFVSLDDEPFYEIEGIARKGISVLKVTSKDDMHNTPTRCRKIKLSFRDSSLKLCRIGRVAIKCLSSNETETWSKE